MLTFDGIIVLLIVAFLLITLYKELLGSGFSFVIAVTVLGIFKILTPTEILAGFGNEQLAVIIMLLIIGDIIRQTSLLDLLFDKIFFRVKNSRSFTARLMFSVSTLSAFINNTPIVAVLMPYVITWGRKNHISSSKLLIPLSYATIIGGCATLVGTSTNLIVNSLVVEQKIIPNLPSLAIFDFAYVGVPMMLIGSLYMIFVGRTILPNSTDPLETFKMYARKYMVEVQVKKGCTLIGSPIRNFNIHAFEDLLLLEVIRDKQSYSSDLDDFLIEENDILLFAGNKGSIAAIVNVHPFLVIPSIGMFAKRKHTEVIEIVIAHNSTLIDKQLDKENFRGKYEATVIAVHRNGENLSGKIGSIIIKAGDALLLLVGTGFDKFSKYTNDFYVISKIKEIKRIGVLRGTILAGGLLAIIILSAFKILSMFIGLIILLTVLLFLKVANPRDLTPRIDYNLILVIALSLALGTAMMKTGVAEIAAKLIVNIFDPFGKVSVLAGIYLITTILAALITNKAALAIVFPISLTASVNLHVNPMPFILVVAYATAANFITPIGYQTNLMVYGPGGYDFKDFVKIGIPLTIIYMAVTITILSLVFF